MLMIRWDPEARADFLGQISYIAERNPNAADKLYEDIEESVEKAAVNPEMYARWRYADTCRIVVRSNYIVIYQVTDTEILVQAFDHARQSNH